LCSLELHFTQVCASIDTKACDDRFALPCCGPTLESMSDSLLLSSNSSQRRSKNFSRDSSSLLPSFHLGRLSASILARMKCIIQQSLLVCPAASRPRTIWVAQSVTLRRTVTSTLAVSSRPNLFFLQGTTSNSPKTTPNAPSP